LPKRSPGGRVRERCSDTPAAHRSIEHLRPDHACSDRSRVPRRPRM